MHGLSKRLARLSSRGACRNAYLPFTEGERKGIGHARDPGPFGMVRHSPSVFQFCSIGNISVGKRFYFSQRRTRLGPKPTSELSWLGPASKPSSLSIRLPAGPPPNSPSIALNKGAAPIGAMVSPLSFG